MLYGVQLNVLKRSFPYCNFPARKLSVSVQSVYKFLNNKAKPVILAMSRPDAKKNIVTLVRAFGENSTLREIANLVLVMGNRSKIDSLAKGSQQVLTTVLKLIDEYDLYGSVAYPKAHTQVRSSI